MKSLPRDCLESMVLLVGSAENGQKTVESRSEPWRKTRGITECLYLGLKPLSHAYIFSGQAQVSPAPTPGSSYEWQVWKY